MALDRESTLGNLENLNSNKKLLTSNVFVARGNVEEKKKKATA